MEIEYFLNWLEIDVRSLGSYWQIIISASIIFCVGIFNHFLNRSIKKRISSSDKKLKNISLHAFQRVIAPLVALILFSVARYIMVQQELPHKILDIAVPLAVSLAIIRLAVYMLRKIFTVTPLLKASENIIVILVWGIFALHILGLLDGLLLALGSVAIKIGTNKITLLGTIKAVLSVIFFVLIALWISKRIEQKLSKMDTLSNYVQIGIAKTIRVIALFIAVLIALDVIGFDLTALTVLGGALGVGIGFGLQRIASNFISGFILIFDRSIRPNDVISIGTSFGWVKELRARYVVIQDRDGVETLIPNENLITTQVINWSYSNRNIRIKLPVQISYGNKPRDAIKMMVEAASEHSRVLKNPEPVGRLMSFGDNGISLELRFWIQDPEEGVNNVRSDVNLAVWDKFQENNITIPFPQHDIHIKEGGKV